MSALSYQIHVLRDRKWSLLKSFTPDDRSDAWNLFVSMEASMGYEGKKLVEEAVKDNGLIFAKTVSFKIFDPTPGGRPPQAGAGAGPGPRNKGRERTPSARGDRGVAGPSSGVVGSLFGFFETYGRKLAGLDHNFFRRDKTVALARFGDPAATARYNGASRAYTTRYADEDRLSVEELVQAESAEVLGSSFFDFVQRNLVTEALRSDQRFHIGICCFAVGALIRIEGGLQLDTSRGRALLADTLGIFLLQEETIQAFIERLATFLSQEASVRFVKAGARCFEYYEVGRLGMLEKRFRETFEARTVDRAEAGEGEDIAILVVRIADVAQLRTEFGTHGVQAVTDHLWSQIEALNASQGGRALKSLGEAVLCAAPSSTAMVAIMAALLRHAEAGPAGAGVPPHRISLGGHFGGAVRKDGDYFGQPVQLAAALAAHAESGEGCLTDAFAADAVRSGATITRRSSATVPGVAGSVSVLHLT